MLPSDSIVHSVPHALLVYQSWQGFLCGLVENVEWGLNIDTMAKLYFVQFTDTEIACNIYVGGSFWWLYELQS